MTSTIPCRICGNDFRPKNRAAVYCSSKCAREGARKRQRNPKLPARECGVCGNEFEPDRRNARYCSRPCARQAHLGQMRTGDDQSNPGPDEPGVARHADGTASLTSDPRNLPPVPWKPEQLLEVHGLDPDEWEIVRVRGNRWGDPGEPMHQLRVDVIPRRDLISIPDPSEWTPPPAPKRRRRKAEVPESVIQIGDHHCPHHDPVMHQLVCEWLADEKPDRGILLGDICDFATISRHRERDGFAQSVNEGLRAAFKVLMDYRHASPDTFWTLLRGNHDDRLVHAMIDNVRGLHRVTAADDEIPALNFRRLLHLDELGVDLIDDDWDRGKSRVGSKLTARHGYLASKNATDQMLTKVSGSSVQGHTHRLALTFRTEHSEDLDEPTTTRVACEAGTAAKIRDGLGYTDEPNWQQGFVHAHIWSDGDFHLAPAVYVPGRLLAPNGRRYTA